MIEFAWGLLLTLLLWLLIVVVGAIILVVVVTALLHVINLFGEKRSRNRYGFAETTTIMKGTK